MKKILLIILLVSLAGAHTQAQKKNKRKTYPVYDVPKRPSENEKFLQTQWWLGFKAGVNSSVANPEEQFSGFSPLNYDPGLTEKAYDDFGNISGHAGLVVTFYHKGWGCFFIFSKKKSGLDQELLRPSFFAQGLKKKAGIKLLLPGSNA